MTRRAGVFVCHCGNNIAATVDVKRVAEELSQDEGVVFSKDYVYMCSDPGQQSIIDAIKEHKLDSVVISCCSPNLHEKTFRDASALGGLNPFQLEIANIREQCAWVHKDKDKAHREGDQDHALYGERARRNEPLTPFGLPVTRKVMVIGGGIAGIQSALDLANAGLEVVLVEKLPSIGGHMIQLSETFPTLDCSQCILSPKMVEVSKNPKITLMTSSEVTSVSGFVGNFKVKVHTKAQYVDPEKCKICDDCTPVCPVVVPNEYDVGLNDRRAIFIPFAQAIPASYYLDPDACLGLNPVVCGKCATLAKPRPSTTTPSRRPPRSTWAPSSSPRASTSTAWTTWPNTAAASTRTCSTASSSSGCARHPARPAVRCCRPSDHKEPKNIVFVQCSGSRDPEQHCVYCSKICCMYTAKHATLYKHQVPDGNGLRLLHRHPLRR